MNLGKNKLELLSGDASFRKFYRKNKSIIVFCKKNKKNNLLIYDAINKILINNKIKAPKLIKQNYRQNFIEIEDLGDNQYLRVIKKNKNKIKYYKKIILLLNKIQKIKNKKIKTFLNSSYDIPYYTKNMLFNESNLFLEWYLPKVLARKNKAKVKKKLSKIFKKLLKKLKNKNNTFVHRDFHVSNLMKYNNKGIAVIDSQDAVYGNSAYDLASLIDDVRIKTSFADKTKIFNEYIKDKKNINISKFKSDFKILSVLRNLKIIGIFTRLSIRDKKNNYLKFIPYAWKLIEMRMKHDPKFEEIKKILDEFFSKKIRNNK